MPSCATETSGVRRGGEILLSTTANFQAELSLSDWKRTTEFSCSGDSREDKLTCDLSITGPSTKYKARRCPGALAVRDKDTLCLHQHLAPSLRVPIPDVAELGIHTSSSTKPSEVEFREVIPVARHQKDLHLLQFEVTLHSADFLDQKENLFICVNKDGQNVTAFSRALPTFLDTLACCSTSGREETLACLFSFDKDFHSDNSLAVEIFKNDTTLTLARRSQVSWLSISQSVTVYLYCLPSILLPLLLFRPLDESKLVCFNLKPEKRIEGERSSPGISEIDLDKGCHVSKRELVDISSSVRSKFLNAQFSPDGNLLVVCCSCTDPNWATRNSAYTLFDSVTFHIFSRITLPLYPDSLAAGNQFSISSLVCCKSFTPFFSNCGDKIALKSSSNASHHGQGKESVYVYTIPVTVGLQSQCRRVIRKNIRETDIESLNLPTLLKKYLKFY